jgi:hypothetical protein
MAGLRPNQLPGRAACQLPDQSTIIRVRPSLTDGSRPRGARSFASFARVTTNARRRYLTNRVGTVVLIDIK